MFQKLVILLSLICIGCASMYTQQNVRNISTLHPGMTKESVKNIMGQPVKTEFSGELSAWHFCKTGYNSDEFAVVIFNKNKLIEARNYTVTLAETGGATGDCSKFIRPVDFSSLRHLNPEDNAKNGSRLGTAWLVGAGYVVTNQHVISNSMSYFLIGKNEEEIELKLVAQDRSNDIAILRAETLSSEPGIPISTGKTNTGSTVFTIGYPHPGILGSSPKLSVGIVNSQTGFMDDPRTYQISVPLQAGNSGGPLIDEYGNAVGIVASKLDALKVFMWTGDLPENINYAIKTSYLCLLLDEYTDVICNQELNEPKKSIEKLTEWLEPKVYQIVAKDR